jgi:acetyl-CoA carboxylase biotin carboxyl carrier protein
MSNKIFDIFDDGDIQSIVTLINTLEESSFDFLKMEGENVKVIIGKNGMSEVAEVRPSPVKSTNDNGASAVQEQFEYDTATPTIAVMHGAVSTDNQEKYIQEHAGIEIVKAPTYGIYYLQAAPGQPPYVKVGDKVNKGDTLGLLEIMKVFNALSSEFDGEITQIHVQDMELVEPGQALVSIKLK